MYHLSCGGMIDQYANRATGNTNYVPIDITHTVGKLLKTNRYMHGVMLDF